MREELLRIIEKNSRMNLKELAGHSLAGQKTKMQQQQHTKTKQHLHM